MKYTIVKVDEAHSKQFGYEPEVKISTSYPQPEVLPQGNTGIASKHPNDAGIESGKGVIFSEDFEAYPIGHKQGEKLEKWFTPRIGSHDSINIVDAAAYGGRGKCAQLLTESDYIQLELRKSFERLNLETVYLRYYEYFAENFELTPGSSHNGISFFAANPNYYNNNIWSAISPDPAYGYNKFNVMHEYNKPDHPQKRDPGRINLYSYYPTQSTWHGDHFFPDGTIRGGKVLEGDEKKGCYYSPHHKPGTEFAPDKGAWYCYDVMVKANSIVDGVVQRDGRMAAWVNGTLMHDYPNFVFRYHDDVKINILRLLIINTPVVDRPSFKLVNNIVVADSYVGPICTTNA